MRQKIKKIILLLAIPLIIGTVFLMVFTRLKGVENSGYYYIDPNGKILNRNLKYQAYTEFNADGIALVYEVKNGGQGFWYEFIDKNGNVIGQLSQENDIYDDVRGSNYAETFTFPIIVKDAGEIVILDKDFNRIGQLKEDGMEIVRFDSCFSEDLARVAVKKDGEELWGYINTNGDWAIEPQFKGARRFTEAGIAVVEEKSTWLGIIKKDGSFITEDRFLSVSKFKGGYAMVQRGGDDAAAFINAEGKYVTDFIYEFDIDNPGFSEGLSFVKLRGEKKYGYINEQGEMVIDPAFGVANEFSHGLAEVSGGRFIDKTGNIVIDEIDNIRINEAEPFSDEGYSVVKVRGKFDGEEFSDRYGIINTKGEWVYEPQFVAEQVESDTLPANDIMEFRAPKYHNGYLVVYLEKGQKIKKAK